MCCLAVPGVPPVHPETPSPSLHWAWVSSLVALGRHCPGHPCAEVCRGKSGKGSWGLSPILDLAWPHSLHPGPGRGG